MRPWVSLLLCAAPFGAGNAHHSRAPFLLDETIEIEGTVTEIGWRAPHVYLTVDALNAEGIAEHWTFEGHSIPGLNRLGWQKDSVQAGQRVVVVANPNRDASKRIALIDSVTRTDGATFYSFRIPEGESVAGSRPRAPAGPSTDFSGTWTRTGRTLRQALVGGFEPPSDWPLTQKGLALVAAYELNDDPYLDCVPVTVPRIALMPYAHHWTRTEDTIVMMREHYPTVRTIHLDGSAPPPDYEPTSEGYSVGRIEEDGGLVIETSGFTPTPWGSARGIDSSEQKRVTERYELTDGGYAINVSYTVEDPVYLLEPVTVTGTYGKIADYEFFDEPCDTETAQRHLQFE